MYLTKSALLLCLVCAVAAAGRDAAADDEDRATTARIPPRQSELTTTSSQLLKKNRPKGTQKIVMKPTTSILNKGRRGPPDADSSSDSSSHRVPKARFKPRRPPPTTTTSEKVYVVFPEKDGHHGDDDDEEQFKGVTFAQLEKYEAKKEALGESTEHPAASSSIMDMYNGYIEHSTTPLPEEEEASEEAEEEPVTESPAKESADPPPPEPQPSTQPMMGGPEALGETTRMTQIPPELLEFHTVPAKFTARPRITLPGIVAQKMQQRAEQRLSTRLEVQGPAEESDFQFILGPDTPGAHFKAGVSNFVRHEAVSPQPQPRQQPQQQQPGDDDDGDAQVLAWHRQFGESLKLARAQSAAARPARQIKPGDAMQQTAAAAAAASLKRQRDQEDDKQEDDDDTEINDPSGEKEEKIIQKIGYKLLNGQQQQQQQVDDDADQLLQEESQSRYFYPAEKKKKKKLRKYGVPSFGGYTLLESSPAPVTNGHSKFFIDFNTEKPQTDEATRRVAEDVEDEDIVQHLSYKLLPSPSESKPLYDPPPSWPFKHPHHFNAHNYLQFRSHLPVEKIEGALDVGKYGFRVLKEEPLPTTMQSAYSQTSETYTKPRPTATPVPRSYPRTVSPLVSVTTSSLFEDGREPIYHPEAAPSLREVFPGAEESSLHINALPYSPSTTVAATQTERNHTSSIPHFTYKLHDAAPAAESGTAAPQTGAELAHFTYGLRAGPQSTPRPKDIIPNFTYSLHDQSEPSKSTASTARESRPTALPHFTYALHREPEKQSSPGAGTTQSVPHFTYGLHDRPSHAASTKSSPQVVPHSTSGLYSKPAAHFTYKLQRQESQRTPAQSGAPTANPREQGESSSSKASAIPHFTYGLHKGPEPTASSNGTSKAAPHFTYSLHPHPDSHPVENAPSKALAPEYEATPESLPHFTYRLHEEPPQSTAGPSPSGESTLPHFTYGLHAEPGESSAPPTKSTSIPHFTYALHETPAAASSSVSSTAAPPTLPHFTYALHSESSPRYAYNTPKVTTYRPPYEDSYHSLNTLAPDAEEAEEAEEAGGGNETSSHLPHFTYALHEPSTESTAAAAPEPQPTSSSSYNGSTINTPVPLKHLAVPVVKSLPPRQPPQGSNPYNPYGGPPQVDFGGLQLPGLRPRPENHQPPFPLPSPYPTRPPATATPTTTSTTEKPASSATSRQREEAMADSTGSPSSTTYETVTPPTHAWRKVKEAKKTRPGRPQPTVTPLSNTEPTRKPIRLKRPQHATKKYKPMPATTPSPTLASPATVDYTPKRLSVSPKTYHKSGRPSASPKTKAKKKSQSKEAQKAEAFGLNRVSVSPTGYKLVTPGSFVSFNINKKVEVDPADVESAPRPVLTSQYEDMQEKVQQAIENNPYKRRQDLDSARPANPVTHRLRDFSQPTEERHYGHSTDRLPQYNAKKSRVTLPELKRTTKSIPKSEEKKTSVSPTTYAWSTATSHPQQQQAEESESAVPHFSYKLLDEPSVPRKKNGSSSEEEAATSYMSMSYESTARPSTAHSYRIITTTPVPSPRDFQEPLYFTSPSHPTQSRATTLSYRPRASPQPKIKTYSYHKAPAPPTKTRNSTSSDPFRNLFSRTKPRKPVVSIGQFAPFYKRRKTTPAPPPPTTPKKLYEPTQQTTRLVIDNEIERRRDELRYQAKEEEEQKEEQPLASYPTHMANPFMKEMESLDANLLHTPTIPPALTTFPAEATTAKTWTRTTYGTRLPPVDDNEMSVSETPSWHKYTVRHGRRSTTTKAPARSKSTTPAPSMPSYESYDYFEAPSAPVEDETPDDASDFATVGNYLRTKKETVPSDFYYGHTATRTTGFSSVSYTPPGPAPTQQTTRIVTENKVIYPATPRPKAKPSHRGQSQKLKQPYTLTAATTTAPRPELLPKADHDVQEYVINDLDEYQEQNDYYYSPTDYAGFGGSELSLREALAANGLSLTAALFAEAGLEDQLDEDQRFTVFAPSDKAWTHFFESVLGVAKGQALKGVQQLAEDKQELKKMLLNHMVEGLVFGRELEDDLVGTALAGAKLRSNEYHTENDEWKEIVLKTINGAVITSTDVEARNALIHVLDRVVFPATQGNLIETLQSDPQQRFTTLLKALQATELDKEIADYKTGPWTLFAPTNDAFMNLPMAELDALIKDRKKLAQLVLNHLVNRSVYTAGLRSHQSMQMANGHRLNVFARRDRVKIEGSYVVNTDISATNGVIQVVENIIELPTAGQTASSQQTATTAALVTSLLGDAPETRKYHRIV